MQRRPLRWLLLEYCLALWNHLTDRITVLRDDLHNYLITSCLNRNR